MGDLLAFPLRRTSGGIVHIMPDPGGFAISHESASGNSWGPIEGPFPSAEDAIVAAHLLARRAYGGCAVAICPDALDQVQTGALLPPGWQAVDF